MTADDAPAAVATQTVERFDVFVACAKEDRDWVEGFLLAGLREAGVRCLDESQFRLGPPLSKLFVEAVEQSDRVLLVASPAFLADTRAEWVKWLATHFGQENSTWPVVSLILEPVKLPLDLAMTHTIDMTEQDRWEAGLQQLVADLHRELPGDDGRPLCPYPGLLAFTGKKPGRGKQPHLFCGRDDEIAEVTEHLRVDPLLAVIGTSGSGKSSLLHAGVEPRLKDDYRVVSLRPGRTPTATLAAAVQKVRTSRRPVVLIVDQFEELFTLSRGQDADPSEIASFCAELITALEPSTSHGIRCIIALRADYYPQLMTCPLWGRVRDHRFELLPLRGDQLREAIQAPASAVGVHIEAALVEALVRDAAGEPGSLPLVQETLVYLWGHLRRRYLPLSAYDALILPGRAYGEPPRTGLQVALARHAEATVSSLSEEDRVTARRIFLRLVQLMDRREDVRRPQRRRELDTLDGSSESVERVLQTLIAARLVTPTADVATADPDETVIDLAHEAIIAGWPSLRAWITERRDAERYRRKLEASAAEWVRLGRSSGGLLDEVELAEARVWLDRPDAAELGVSADLAEFVSVSSDTLGAARARKARQDRMFRVLSAALAVLLVAAGISAIIAVGQRNEAQDGRLRARADQLGLTAESLPPEQLDRALLLGQEGLALRRTPLTVGGALAALTSNPSVERMLHAESAQLAIAVTADGRTAVTGGQDGVVRVWDPTNGGVARDLAALPGEIRSVAVSPDARTVGASSSEGAVGQWDLASGDRIALTGSATGPVDVSHEGSVRAVAYSPDGSLFATAGQDGVVLVRDARSGRIRHTLKGYRDWLNAVVFTPDGRLLAGAGGQTEGRSVDQRILIWDVTSGRLRAELPGHDDAVRSLAVSSDGATLASAGAEGSIKLWSLPDGRLRRQLTGHQDRVFGVAFSPSGKVLASAGRDHTVRLWDPATGRASADPLRGHGDSVRGISFAAEDRVVSVGNDNRLIVWNARAMPQARLATPLADQPQTTRAVGADPTGTLIATGDDSGRVVVRRTTDGMATGVTVDAAGPVSGVALGPASLLVTATYDGRLRVWDARSGAARTPLLETGEGSLVVAISPDGKIIATGGESNVIRLRDQALRPTEELVGHRNWVRALAFMPRTSGSDDALVSAGADGVAYLWRRLTAAARPTALGERSSLMESLAISPDGRTIATGNAEGQVILWDATQSDVRSSDRPKLAGHDGTVTGISYGPSGDVIVTADADGTVRLWAADSGLDPLGTLGHIGAVADLVVPSDQHAFSVGDGAPAHWALDQQEWRRISCAAAGRNLRAEEAVRYGFPAPPLTCPGAP